jgi:hypothetical protein
LRRSAAITPASGRGAGRAVRRAAMLTAAVLAAAAACASGAQADTPTVTVTGDSVLVTGQSPGPTTVRVTRPDTVTHQPVVIGQYEESAPSVIPFTVNTTAGTPLVPNGDCWQKGALASALTPDLQPGDTVTVTQATPAAGQPSSTSVPVTADDVKDAAGPVPVCKDSAPWGRNAVTAGPESRTGSPIALSGMAQPFAKLVELAATDGVVSTAPVAVGPAADGTWSATIPAGQADRLASGLLTVTPVFEVPDVSTGATAHIAGPAVQISRSSAAAPGPGGSRPAGLRVRSLRRPARIGLQAARRKGILTSFVVPAGANVVRVQLERGHKAVMQRLLPAGRAGARQTVRLRGAGLRRVLDRGRFRIAVSAGPSRDTLGPPVTGAIVIR